MACSCETFETMTKLKLSEKLGLYKNQKPHLKDPWHRFEAWRYAPEFNTKANLKRAFPGLGIGFGAFLVLAAFEELYWKPNHPEADDHH